MATPTNPPNCLDAIIPEDISASCCETEASIVLGTEGTDIALPIPTSINAPFNSHKDELTDNWDNNKKPIICTLNPVVMIRIALMRRATREDIIVDTVSTAVKGMKAMPVWNAP